MRCKLRFSMVFLIITYLIMLLYSTIVNSINIDISNGISIPQGIATTAVSFPSIRDYSFISVATAFDKKMFIETTYNLQNIKTSEVHEDLEVIEALPQLFDFPDFVSEDVRLYLIEVYEQAYDSCKDIVFPDPFMAMSLSVVENPVKYHEVFRLPLVSQDVLDKALSDNEYKFSAAIQYSYTATSFNASDCVGPLCYEVEYIDTNQYNPTIWSDSCRLFYESLENALPRITVFAKECGISVDNTFLYTVCAMRHNVGNLCCWAWEDPESPTGWVNSDPDSQTNRSFIPFISKRAVYEWNAAVASEPAQTLIKQAAYNSYLQYLETGIIDNNGIGWEEVAEVAGYDKNKVLPDYQWWRPLYNVRFWFNYYQLRLLYGADNAATLGVSLPEIENINTTDVIELNT